jgi:hypothetical protein
VDSNDILTRTLKVERLYSLGDYKNIKFVSEIYNVPRELAFNKEVMDKINYLMLLDIESNFRKYVELSSTINTLKIEDTMKYLEEERINTLDELNKIISV